MSNVDIALLPPFIAVAELASFSAAAKRLRVDRSSISRSIARLEAVIGARLLHRTTRQVALSDVGKALYAKLREPLAGLDDAVREIAGLLDGLHGRLVVTAPADFGAVVLSKVVARFMRLYPQIDVDVRLTSALLDLVADGIDAAIRISSKRLRDSTMKVARLGVVRLGIFASPAYLERRGTPHSPSDGQGHDWVVFPSTQSMLFSSAEATAQITSRGHLSCDDMFFVHHAVLNGIGLGVLPWFLAEPDVVRGRMVHLFPTWTASHGDVWFMTAATKLVPRTVTVFRQLLVEVLAQQGMAFSPT